MRKVCAHLHDSGLLRWNSQTVEQYIEYLRAKSPVLPEAVRDLTKINLLNGIYDVEKGQLLPHSPKFLSTIQINARYNPDATCFLWNKFLSEVLPADCRDFIFEVVAWLMVPYVGIQRAVVLTGEGANGKSLLLHAIAHFIGRQNVSSYSLSDIESGRFVAACLYNKLVNICTDLPSVKLRTVNKFKKITSSDLIVGEKKYRDSFEFRPFCRLIFSTNQTIISEDVSEAFFRRILIVPFPNTFVEDPKTHREIEDGLTSEWELSGVLNEALQRLPSVLERGLNIPQSVEKATLDFRASYDPMATWLNERTVEREDWFTDTETLYRDFVKFAGYEVLDRSSFSRKLLKLKPSLRRRRRHSRGYYGIALRPESDVIELSR